MESTTEIKTIEQQIRDLAEMLARKAKENSELRRMATDKQDQALFLGLASAQSQIAKDLRKILED